MISCSHLIDYKFDTIVSIGIIEILIRLRNQVFKGRYHSLYIYS